jgi:hypothetical protein
LKSWENKLEELIKSLEEVTELGRAEKKLKKSWNKNLRLGDYLVDTFGGRFLGKVLSGVFGARNRIVKG